MSDDPNDLARHADLARDAYTSGQAALGRGDKAEGIRWLERAHRLAPGDIGVALALASALIGENNARAAALFTEVLSAADVREAWLGLAAARFLAGDPAAARDALSSTLGRHSPHPGIAGLAERVAAATGAPGWCGLSGDGFLIVHTAGTDQIHATIDGQPVVPCALPPIWPRARRLTVVARNDSGDQHLIGSPVSPAVIGRTEGFVEATDTGLRGWAWHPNDPETDPVLTVVADGIRTVITASEPTDAVPGHPPLARPRSFVIPWNDLPGSVTLAHVIGRDGRHLLGSPAIRNPARELPPGSRSVRLPRQRGLAVIVRPHAQAAITRSCLDSVITTVDAGVRIILRAEADEDRGIDLAGHARRVTILSGGIGPGMEACPDHDLVLLDAGALLPAGWLERLRDAAYTAHDIGTVSPLSNLGEAAYPTPEGAELVWFEPERRKPARARRTSEGERELDIVARLNRLARRANGELSVDLPVARGPCLFISGDCLAEVGSLRSAAFAQGPGEQEDFCMRADEAGWRHVALTGLFVGQRARAPHGDAIVPPSAAWNRLLERNMALLRRLHPAMDRRTEVFRSAGLLAPARRRIDLERWRRSRLGTAIFVTHDDGGGVALRVEAAVAAHEARGHSAIVLRPERLPDGTQAVVASDGSSRRFPNLRFVMPKEQPALLRLLRAARPIEAEIHHLLNHDPSVFQTIRALRIPYDVHVHDFASYCPRIGLVGAGEHYCGEPELTACEACVAKNGSYLHEEISVKDLRARSWAMFSGARRLIAPSPDTAQRMERHFPGLPIVVTPHEDDDGVDEPPPIPLMNGTVRVCVAGAIGLHKGFHLLLACARDASEQGLDLTFVVAGTTIDDQSLLDTGRVFVTGRYQPEEAVDLIRAQDAALAWLPSIWPETWCLALTELWRAGLRVAAFDIGAPAERIRRTGRGFLLPLGLSPPAINHALLNAARGRSFLPISRPSAYKPSR